MSSASDRPHRVLEEDALIGTRLVEALRAACGPLCAVNPCSTCAPNDRSNKGANGLDHADELRVMHGGDDTGGNPTSPTFKVWSEAYEEFRSSTRRPADGRVRVAEVSSQLDEVNARLAADLDANGGSGDADMSYATPGVLSAANARGEGDGACTFPNRRSTPQRDSAASSKSSMPPRRAKPADAHHRSKPPSDPNTFRVLIATDTHLGAHESNAIRKDDAFLAFEEIFQKAKAHAVDAVFLAGDVFDVNKPSRETLVRCMDILREHTRGDASVEIEVLSDAKENFPSRGLVNYEDPNVNVGLPVFSIHGNHDDPAGEANLSAMDILSSAGLVNYFGKHALGGGGAGRVDLKPVLMRKGTTKLALYGLGYIRDNRLHQMFSVKGCVRWHRPAETETCSSSSWFNVMLIHQNRAAHSKNAISDRYLPSWLDFVVWGHEHECLVEPTESAQGFHISQPGSSVVTSLIEGEAKQKKICVLEVRSDPENPNGAPYWRTTPIDLETTRPFEFDQVALASVEEIDASDPKGIAAYLERRVNTMIDRAARKHRERHAPKEIDMTDRLNLPLIRLRVDYSGGFSTINPQRFGQKFVGKVANPHDVLLFHKSQKKRNGVSNGVDEEMADGVDAEYEEDPQADGMLENQRRIDRLVREHLSTSEGLQLLTPNDLSAALDDFVNRDEKAAISKLCQTRLKAIQTSVNADERGTDDVSELLSKIHDAVQVQLKKPSKHKPVMDENTAPKNAAGDDKSTGATASRKPTSAAPETALEPVVEQVPELPRAQTKTPVRRAPATRRKSTAISEPIVDVVSEDEIEDSDIEEIPMSNPVTKSRPTRAATIASMRNKKKMTAVAEDSDDSFDEADEVIDASDEDVAPAPSTRGRKRPAHAPTKTPKRKAAKPPSGRARSTRAATTVDDDSGDDVDEIVAPSRTRATRTASGMTQGGTQSTWGRSRR